MEKYACRGMMEIDIASKRIYEDLGILYDKLIHINIEDNQILTVKEKREEAYNKLLIIAKKLGKEKQFIENATKYQETFGYREYPKYTIVYIISMLHKLMLEQGDKWMKEGRLEEVYHIFDLHVEERYNQKDKKINYTILKKLD